MESYTMFLDWKNQYCENDSTTQSNLQIQCNPYQITNGIIHRWKDEQMGSGFPSLCAGADPRIVRLFRGWGRTDRVSRPKALHPDVPTLAYGVLWDSSKL